VVAHLARFDVDRPTSCRAALSTFTALRLAQITSSALRVYNRDVNIECMRTESCVTADGVSHTEPNTEPRRPLHQPSNAQHLPPTNRYEPCLRPSSNGTDLREEQSEDTELLSSILRHSRACDK